MSLAWWIVIALVVAIIVGYGVYRLSLKDAERLRGVILLHALDERTHRSFQEYLAETVRQIPTTDEATLFTIASLKVHEVAKCLDILLIVTKAGPYLLALKRQAGPTDISN